MNIFKYSLDNKVFDERLKNALSKVKNDFKLGKIKTQTDYVYEIKNTIFNFYKNINKPIMNIKEFKDLLYKDILIEMIDNAKDDMNVILSGSSDLSKVLHSAQTAMHDNIKFLNLKIEGALDKTNKLDNRVSNLKRDSSLLYKEEFKEQTNTFKSSAISSTLDAFCDLSTQVLTLPVTKHTSLAGKVNFKILEESNGFPGNTHEIYKTSSSNNIRFKGEENPHLNLDNIKYTSDSSVAGLQTTDWFEFELFNIKDDDRIKLGDIGFRYKEGISWVSDDNKLDLYLKIELQEIATLNSIVLSSIPKTNETKTPVIKTITMSDDFSKSTTLHINKDFEDKVIINFESQEVKYFIVHIEQKEAYLTNVCRHYALNVDPLKIPKFLDDEYQNYLKYEKPIHSIELLNLKYDKENRKIVYPSTSDKENFVKKEYTRSKLFLLNSEDMQFNIKKESIQAFRYSIGVSEVDARYREYESTGIFISKLYKVDEEIKSLTFEADDFLPKSFTDENKDNYIKYSITLDGGSNYIDIFPKQRAHLGPSCICINDNGAIVNRNKNVYYHDTLLEVKSFQVKIELSRPKNKKADTPIVSSFAVSVNTEEDL